MQSEIKYECFPDGVHPVQGETARYRVVSGSRPDREHFVDVCDLRCDCERDIFYCQRVRTKKGFLPYADMCQHLKAAIAYHGLLMAKWQSGQ